MLVKFHFNRNNSNIHTSDRGEITFNRYTGALSSGWQPLMNDDKEGSPTGRIYITREIGVRTKEARGGNPQQRFGRSARLTHYSVTVINNEEYLLIASDGLETAYYYMVSGVSFGYFIKEGTYDLEGGYKTLITELLTNNRPFTRRFWVIANKFICQYLGDNQDTFEFPKFILTGEKKNLFVSYLGVDNDSGTLKVYTEETNFSPNSIDLLRYDEQVALNNYKSICVTKPPVLQLLNEKAIASCLEDIDTFFKTCMLRDGGIVVDSVAAVEESKEVEEATKPKAKKKRVSKPKVVEEDKTLSIDEQLKEALATKAMEEAETEVVEEPQDSVTEDTEDTEVDTEAVEETTDEVVEDAVVDTEVTEDVEVTEESTEVAEDCTGCELEVEVVQVSLEEDEQEPLVAEDSSN